MPIKNRVALITGGSKGIGYYCAKELLKRGLRGVTIADIDSDNGNKAVREFGKDKAHFIQCDTSNFRQLKDAFEEAVRKFENLDIVVNNAAIIDEKDWCKMIDINLKSVIQGTYMSLAEYVAKRRTGKTGLVINMSATNGLIPVSCSPVYSSINHGIIGFTRTIGTSYFFNKTKTKVVAFCPGATLTSLLEDRYEVFEEEMEKTPPQKPGMVAETFCNLVEMEPENGTTWVSNGPSDPFQVKFVQEF